MDRLYRLPASVTVFVGVQKGAPDHHPQIQMVGVILDDDLGLVLLLKKGNLLMYQKDVYRCTGILTMFLALWPHTASAQTCDNLWETKPLLDVGSQRARACTTPNGDIYVFGGSQSSQLARGEKLTFDGVGYASAWTPVADMPVARSDFALVCVGDFIYAIGGNTPGESATATVDRYEIATDVWDSVTVPDLAIGRTLIGATTDCYGRIWVGGGASTTGTILDSVEIYDPAVPGGGWIAGPSLNNARLAHSFVTDEDGSIYAIGGQDSSSGHLASIERFVPAVGWELLVVALPAPVSNTDLSVLGADGMIYIAGGWLPGFTDRVLRFDPVLETFVACVPMSQSLNHVALTLGANGRIFRIGGEASFFTGERTVECLDTLPSVCSADITGPLGVPDGTVNVTDLLLLLASWGLCP